MVTSSGQSWPMLMGSFPWVFQIPISAFFFPVIREQDRIGRTSWTFLVTSEFLIIQVYLGSKNDSSNGAPTLHACGPGFEPQCHTHPVSSTPSCVPRDTHQHHNNSKASINMKETNRPVPSLKRVLALLNFLFHSLWILSDRMTV